MLSIDRNFTAVLGVFFFLYAGLHDVTFDFVTWIRESAEDQMTARVGGPAYFGWPVRGCSSRFYSDDLSFAHAQGSGLSLVQLLRGRTVRWLAGLLALRAGPPTSSLVAAGPSPATGGGGGGTSNQAQGDGGRAAARGAEEDVAATAALRCRLTRGVMADPVVAADGYSYERADMEKYLEQHSVSPVTGRPLAFTRLFPNNQLRNVIRAWQRDAGGGAGAGEAGGGWRQAGLDEVRCPITMSPMHDAVMTCDGHRCLPSTSSKHACSVTAVMTCDGESIESNAYESQSHVYSLRLATATGACPHPGGRLRPVWP